MNTLDSAELRKANIQAIFNMYLYLSSLNSPVEGESFESAVKKLNSRDGIRAGILREATEFFPELKRTVITEYTHSADSLTACCFVTGEEVSVAFKGTGNGEWLDNGEGLSGIPVSNTYEFYFSNGNVSHSFVEKKDYASFGQVQALNWFNKTAAKKGWTKETPITVSGHSKGGNKAQFVTVNSPLPDVCFSFNGQGFSPEAVEMMKDRFEADFEERRRKILSLCAENDYVNVLGKSIVHPENVFYFESWGAIHLIEGIIDPVGRLREQSDQGRLSRHISAVSDEIMELEPSLREYATVGIMNIFQKYIGRGTPVNSGKISEEKTLGAIVVATGVLLKNVKRLGRFFK